MFTRLADIEIRHKEKLLGLYKVFKPNVSHMEAFEDLIIPEVMEGGLTTEGFLELNKPALRTIPDVLEMAMALETQDLDLYLRYSLKSEEEKTKKSSMRLPKRKRAI
jgi:rubrerythrin